jgi:hypothetical protein
MSYMFEDYETALNGFTKSANLYETQGNKQFAENTKNYSIALLNLLHNRLDKVKTNDPVLKAFLSYKMGDSDKALSILAKNEPTLCSKAMTPFIIGLATNHPAMIYDSLGMFVYEGDLWNANMPRIELLRMGEPPYAVDHSIQYKVKDFKGVKNFEAYCNRNVISFRASSGGKSS